MTYHPKTIMPCALFLATKTDNYYLSLNEFAKAVPKIEKPADVIAPEYTLTQGLRYTFDVRHPFRGLEGGIMELQAIALGEGKPAPYNGGQTPESMKQAIHNIAPVSSSDKGSITTRVLAAHGKARELLKTAAQMTDAYFFYTPSQIWLAALLVADKPLTQFYLETKLGPSAQIADASNPLEMIRTKLMSTLSDCSRLLESYSPLSSNPETIKDLKRIAKKVYQCQMVEKLDPAAPGSGQKRSTGKPGAEGTSESELERVAKKRRLERERREQEGRDIFGGELVAQRSKAGEK
jgi:cyclin H